MKVVRVDKKTYGKFHTGDSYILLSVRLMRMFYDLLELVL